MKQVDLQGNVWDCSVGNFEPPISAYGSIDINELYKTIEKFKKVPDYNELIKDNNNLQQKVEQLENIRKEAIESLEKQLLRYLNESNYKLNIFDLRKTIDILNKGSEDSE